MAIAAANWRFSDISRLSGGDFWTSLPSNHRLFTTSQKRFIGCISSSFEAHYQRPVKETSMEFSDEKPKDWNADNKSSRTIIRLPTLKSPDVPKEENKEILVDSKKQQVEAGNFKEAAFLNAVVQVYCTHTESDYSLPWHKQKQYTSTGSTFMIEDGKLLTNARCVEHDAQVLADEVNIGYEDKRNEQVLKLNGTRIRNIQYLPHLVDTCKDRYLDSEFEDNILVVLENTPAFASKTSILKGYGIPSKIFEDLPHPCMDSIEQNIEAFGIDNYEYCENGVASNCFNHGHSKAINKGLSWTDFPVTATPIYHFPNRTWLCNELKRNCQFVVHATQDSSGARNRQRAPPGVDTRIHWEKEDEGWIGTSSASEQQKNEQVDDLLDEKFSDLLNSSTDSYYQFLGLAANADMEAIKSAYRKLSKEYHPDTTTLPLRTASEKFMKLKEIYDVLSDGEKRKFYDWTLAQETASREAEKMRMKLEDPYKQDVDNWESIPDMVDRLGGRNMELNDQAKQALTFDVLVIIFTICCIIYVVFFKQPDYY